MLLIGVEAILQLQSGNPLLASLNQLVGQKTEKDSASIGAKTLVPFHQPQ